MHNLAQLLVKQVFSESFRRQIGRGHKKQNSCLGQLDGSPHTITSLVWTLMFRVLAVCLCSACFQGRVEKGNVPLCQKSWGAAATPEHPATPASSPNSQVEYDKRNVPIK